MSAASGDSKCVDVNGVAVTMVDGKSSTGPYLNDEEVAAVAKIRQKMAEHGGIPEDIDTGEYFNS